MNGNCEMPAILFWTPNIYLYTEIKPAVDACLESTLWFPMHGFHHTVIQPKDTVCLARGNPEGIHNIAQ